MTTATDPEIDLACWQYTDLDSEYKKARALREELARGIASRLLGVEMPAVRTFEDKDGSLWSVTVHATLKCERRGPALLLEG